MKFSVIIAAQDRPEVLDEVLAALPDVEITVAYRYIEPPSDVVLVDCNHLPSTWQIGAMKNQGAGWACGDYLIFLDGDCIPQEGWLESYQEAMKTNDLAIGRIDREEPGLIRAVGATSVSLRKRLIRALIRPTTAGGGSRTVIYSGA